MAEPRTLQAPYRARTPPREDGDAALQAFQDALLWHLTVPGHYAAEAPAVRVFAWTVDDARLAPDMAHAFAVLEEGHRLAEAAIPADAPGATHSALPDLLLEVSRPAPELASGQHWGWHGLIPIAADVVRDAFGPRSSPQNRGWLLDTLERQVLETFWRTAYDAPGGPPEPQDG